MGVRASLMNTAGFYTKADFRNNSDIADIIMEEATRAQTIMRMRREIFENHYQGREKPDRDSKGRFVEDNDEDELKKKWEELEKILD